MEINVRAHDWRGKNRFSLQLPLMKNEFSQQNVIWILLRNVVESGSDASEARAALIFKCLHICPVI
jgi:hypothetical protein